MIPLVFAEDNRAETIRRLSGTPETRQHLADLGFVPGSPVTVISRVGGNLIVKVKESRIALDKELAQKIMI